MLDTFTSTATSPAIATTATEVLSWQQRIENTGIDHLYWVSVFEREGQNICPQGVKILSYSLWTFTVKHYNLCFVKTCSFSVNGLLYVFFWVIPRHLNFICRHFRTLCSIFIGRPMKMEQTECFETSAYKIQTPGTYSEENIQHTEHGKSLKSGIQ
jgi:hypothetical protein